MAFQKSFELFQLINKNKKMPSIDSPISESSKHYLSTTKYAAARKSEENDTIIVWDEKVMEGSSGGSDPGWGGRPPVQRGWQTCGATPPGALA